MQNYICEGERIKAIAPVGGIVSGQLHLIGAKVAVAITSAIEGATYTARTEGVFEIAKATGVVTQGAKLYFDATNKVITTTATSNTLVGWAYEAAASGDATAYISINQSV